MGKSENAEEQQSLHTAGGPAGYQKFGYTPITQQNTCINYALLQCTYNIQSMCQVIPLKEGFNFWLRYRFSYVSLRSDVTTRNKRISFD